MNTFKPICPCCNKIFDFFDGDFTPKSIVLCSGCYVLLVPNKEGILEKINDELLKQLEATHPEILQEQKRLSALIKMVKNGKN